MAARKSAEEKAAELAGKITAEVTRSAGKGLLAARLFLTARVKETLSVPAPRKKIPGGGYRATTRATKGAPPRKLSGRLRTSVTGQTVSPTEEIIGASARGDPPQNFNYPRYHEVVTGGMPGSGQHKYVEPTADKYRTELTRIVGGSVTVDTGGP